MASTAAPRYDFSCFSTGVSIAFVMSIFSPLPPRRPAWTFWLAQAELGGKKLSGRYFGTFFACWVKFLRKLANVGGGRGILATDYGIRVQFEDDV